uniref:Uncharacterized protein n=1 Tax=Cucumis sativus TaxID=3659 RepID=A0A0A0LCA8_CUCSA
MRKEEDKGRYHCSVERFRWGIGECEKDRRRRFEVFGGSVFGFDFEGNGENEETDVGKGRNWDRNRTGPYRRDPEAIKVPRLSKQPVAFPDNAIRLPIWILNIPVSSCLSFNIFRYKT